MWDFARENCKMIVLSVKTKACGNHLPSKSNKSLAVLSFNGSSCFKHWLDVSLNKMHVFVEHRMFRGLGDEARLEKCERLELM